ncbi:MAG TPA: class I SAM-dependent methyltransferase [Solirubrobacteraceae bacterium]|jgi:hypothetical protein|nr:class I SAM-dependent methyltransferase [Solirubrobacteraceae bacterium]
MVAPGDRDFVGQLSRAIGGLSVLEECLLVAVLKAVRPTNVFEFGTYLGDTARLLARNLAVPGSAMYTLDLASTAGIEFEGKDAALASQSVVAERSFDGSGAQVVQLLGDSYDLDPTPYAGRIGLVFIDGNHALKYVERDTANALRMVPKHGPSAIVWHDYGTPEYPMVKQYVDSLSEQMALCHIEETLLAVALLGVELPGRQSA